MSSRTADLRVRTISALLMLVISGTALWLGGMAWLIFVLVVGIGVWIEWSSLSIAMTRPGARRTIWRAGGAIYCGIAAAMLITLRDLPQGIGWVLLVVGAVIATDIGAYALGRAIGGPKIAPRISPSKTWAGLLGGIIGASLVVFLVREFYRGVGFAGDIMQGYEINFVAMGAVIAVLAQFGDFFESWMKRRAGVKDSGSLIPGHGGLFDRVDGLLAVVFVLGLLIPLGRFV